MDMLDSTYADVNLPMITLAVHVHAVAYSHPFRSPRSEPLSENNATQDSTGIVTVLMSTEHRPVIIKNTSSVSVLCVTVMIFLLSHLFHFSIKGTYEHFS